MFVNSDASKSWMSGEMFDTFIGEGERKVGRVPRRQRFFLTNDGEQFGKFDRFSGGRCGRNVRDGLSGGFDPIDTRVFPNT